MFLIIAINNNKPNDMQYYAIDHASTGYPYWSNYISSAKFFNTYEEAEKELQDSWFTREQFQVDSEIFPPSALHTASGLCYAQLKGSVDIKIQEVMLKTVWEHHYDVEIKGHKL